MGRKRRTFSADKKAKVALEALREVSTTAEIARTFDVHASQVVKWKEQALSQLVTVFDRASAAQEQSNSEAQLYEEVGRLQVELRFLKKKLKGLGQL